MNLETGQDGITEADREFNAPPTGEVSDKEQLAMEAISKAAEATPESILKNPDQLASDWESQITTWENEVRNSQEILARPDLSDNLRRDWEKQLVSDQKQLDYHQQRYNEFKQRNGRAA